MLNGLLEFGALGNRPEDILRNIVLVRLIIHLQQLLVDAPLVPARLLVILAEEAPDPATILLGDALGDTALDPLL